MKGLGTVVDGVAGSGSMARMNADDLDDVLENFDPHDVQPLDPDEFMILVQIAQAAGMYKVPLEGKARRMFTPPDYGRGGYVLRDTPFNRASVALVEQCEGDPGKVHSVITRWSAIGKMIESPSIEPWTQEVPDEPEATLIHPAVFYVGATMEYGFDPEGFDEAEFFRRVADAAAELDVDEPDESPGT